MKYKYLILDFGKVLAGPTTGHWFVTPKFTELVDMNLIDETELENAIKKHGEIKSRPMTKEREEYEMFYEFYNLILKEIDYPHYNQELIHNLAYNFAYEDDKYTFYPDVHEELKLLSKKYNLILLTDNWPSVARILDKQNLTKYFDKIYISSCYGVEKKDKIFFNYPIKDFNIKENEALFIDDNTDNLKIAKELGLNTILMDRENKITKSSYSIINNLFQIIDKY